MRHLANYLFVQHLRHFTWHVLKFSMNALDPFKAVCCPGGSWDPLRGHTCTFKPSEGRVSAGMDVRHGNILFSILFFCLLSARYLLCCRRCKSPGTGVTTCRPLLDRGSSWRDTFFWIRIPIGRETSFLDVACLWCCAARKKWRAGSHLLHGSNGPWHIWGIGARIGGLPQSGSSTENAASYSSAL